MTLTKELVIGAITVFGGGFGAHQYMHFNFAEKEPVLVAGAQVQYILSKQEASIVRDIAILEREQQRRRLTPTEQDRLRALREELKEMREVRRGKQ